MVLHKTAHGLKDPGPETRLVGTAVQCRDQIDVSFRVGHHIATPAQGPGGALPFGETIGVPILIRGPRKNRRGQFEISDDFREVFRQTFAVLPDDGFLLREGEAHLQTGEENGLGAQEMGELPDIDFGRVEILPVRPYLNPRAMGARAAVFQSGQRLADIALGKR